MTMTMSKQIELAEQKRMKELQAKCDMVNAMTKKQMKKDQIKENLKFRGRCLKGLIIGK